MYFKGQLFNIYPAFCDINQCIKLISIRIKAYI